MQQRESGKLVEGLHLDTMQSIAAGPDEQDFDNLMKDMNGKFQSH